jgi:O-antigen ligase
VCIDNLKRLLSYTPFYTSMLVSAWVIAGYCVPLIDSIRGPSPIFFTVALICYLFSKKIAISLSIFLLPLLPNSPSQLALIFEPAVPYFITHPGIDIATGLFVGFQLENFAKKNRFVLFDTPWPVGAIALVIGFSSAVAVARNLWQSQQLFCLEKTITQSIKFKTLERGVDYLPLADLIVYWSAIAFFIVLVDYFKHNENRADLFFKPIIFSVFISACWGLFQSYSGFGLGDNTLGYRPELIGLGANGFQPDLHAFAGHMAIGAVGILGYIKSKDTTRFATWWYGSVVLISWIALVLSKSRATLALSTLLILILLFNHLRKKSFNLFRTILIFSLCMVMLLVLLIFSNNHYWIIDFFQKFSLDTLTDFNKLNELSSKRLELFRAALLMFIEFPIGGVGQGNLFRLSAIESISQSSYMVLGKGENAHNYFLQTLAELGLIGVVCFCFLFFWPLIRSKNYQHEQTPVIIWIMAVFIGNVYSHSLLIRENLFLLAAGIAVLYANSMAKDWTQKVVFGNGLTIFPTRLQVICWFLGVAIVLWGIEIYLSFYKFPFASS